MAHEKDKIFQSHREKPTPPRRLFNLRVSSFFEALLFLTACVSLDYFFGSGDRWVGMQLHPFWIIVLIMSVNYGTLEGVVTAMLATIFLYAWNVPSQTVEETPFEYQVRLTLVPLLWFLSAFILGEIRSRLSYDKYTLELKAYEESTHADKIAEGFEEQRSMREALETHIASEKVTISKVYEVLKTLERNSPGSLLQSLDPVISFALNPKKFSIFELGPNGMEIITAFGWDESEPYLRRISNDHPLYQGIVKKKHLVSIINDEDKMTLADQGILACPLSNPENNEIFGLVKIEDISLKQLNISSIKTFQMVCYLIGSAYANAIEYKKVKEMQIFDTTYTIFSHQLFIIEKERVLKQCQNLSMPCTQINLLFSNLFIKRDEKEITEVIDKLKEFLPDGCEMYLGKRNKLVIHLLLPFMKKKRIEEIHSLLATAFTDEALFKEYVPKIEVDFLYKAPASVKRVLGEIVHGA